LENVILFGVNYVYLDYLKYALVGGLGLMEKSIW